MAKLSGQSCGDFQPGGACPFTPLPFEDRLSTQARQTGLRNKPQEKHTRELLAMIHAWIVSSLI